MPERGSKTTMVSVVWTNLEFFGAIQMIFCRARLVTMDETWLYHYDPGTKQQSMEWRHSGSPRPNNFWGQKFAGKFSPWLFWIETASSSLSSKGPNYQRGILLISAGANEGYFEGNTPRGVHQGGLVLERQCHGSPATCNPEETGLPGLPVSWSSTLFSGSGPIWLPLVPWTEKTIERSQFFVRRGGHFCRGDLVGRKNILIFF